MKTTILAIILAIGGALAQAQVSNIVKEISPYVSPNNRAAAPPSFTYAPDGQGYLLLSSDARTIDRYDIATGKKLETVFDVANTRENTLKSIEGFQMSDNGRYILVYTNHEAIYRRTFTAEYYVYEVRTRLLRPLSTNFARQQSPLMSSDGRMVAFMAEDNNIYIHKNDYNSEVRVTDDGEKNRIINGVPDWVYEEEFSTACSMAWAPDNLNLCYLKYNETDVPMYTLPLYQGTCDPMDEYAFYPGIYSYKYPVAGQPNSVVTLHSYDVETRKIKDIILPDKVYYIPRIAYGSTPENLMVSTLNRDQNHYEIYSVNPKSGISKSIYIEDSSAWIEECSYTDLTCLEDGFVIQSSKSGYNHLYKYNYAGSLVRTYTSGNYDVTAFYGIDAKGNCYYQSAAPTPMDRTISCVDAKGKVTTISKGSGTSSARFSKDMAYAMMSYSDAQTPPRYTINTAAGKEVRVLEDNAAYAARNQNMPKKEFFTMTSDGYTLNGYIIRATNGASKTPVIMYQYSGPGSQSVLNSWSMDWENYYATQGYTIVCVDGRGTGGRGRAFMDVVYKQLGRYETIDQVNVAKWIAQQSWADAKNIGIFGWSFGGYEALMAASADGNPFAAAVSVAPVTNWKFYDTIYTERYMLTPQQNNSNYETYSPINRTMHLSCPLLIMYGTADDNVHPQNSLQYVSMLQSQGGLCDMFVFPNKNHGIYGCNARAVVYGKMLHFFQQHLSNK